MVDIPEIKREYSATPALQSQVNLDVPKQTTLLQDQVSKSLGEGVDYFHKQVETASKDEAVKADNALREEFNQGYNVGYGEGDLGVKNIEGYDSFKTARTRLEERLNKKRDELVNKEGLSDYAREVIKNKLDDSFSTYHYYMDTQEGQVKNLDAHRNQQVQMESKKQDLAQLFTLYNGTPQANHLLQNKISDMENANNEFYFGRGLATREQVVDKDGHAQWAYKLSPPAQFEMQKTMSEAVSESVTNLMTKNPAAAKAAMQEFGKYVLPNVQPKINKVIETATTEQDSYGKAYAQVVLNGDKPEVQKQIEDSYVAKNDMDGLEKFRQKLSVVRSQSVKQESVLNDNALAAAETRKNQLLLAGAPITTFADALKDPVLAPLYVQMQDSQKHMKKFEGMFVAPKTVDFDTLQNVQKLLQEHTDKDAFVAEVNKLPENKRQAMYSAWLGFNIKNPIGNPNKNAWDNWLFIKGEAKKDDNIFDTTDANKESEAYNAWMKKIDDTKQVYPRGSKEAAQQVQEFIDEQRKQNGSWLGGMWKSVVPSFGYSGTESSKFTPAQEAAFKQMKKDNPKMRDEDIMKLLNSKPIAKTK